MQFHCSVKELWQIVLWVHTSLVSFSSLCSKTSSSTVSIFYVFLNDYMLSIKNFSKHLNIKTIMYYNTFKGTVPWDFWPSVFFIKLPASAVSMRPWNPYKNFNIKFFCQIVRFQHKTMSEKFGFRGFNDTEEADSVVSMRPQKQIQRSQWDRWRRFGGFNETAEADSAVSMRPLNPWWHRGSLCENDYGPSIPLKGYYSKIHM
jgi:hypothetical protein